MFKILEKLQGLFVIKMSDWNIGIVNKPIYTFLEGNPPVTWLPILKKNVFLADPFGVKIKDELFIFAEEYNHEEKKGYISLIKDGTIRRILETKIHASYPFLIEENGKTYCVPETYGAKKLVLYMASKFPYKWDEITTIMAEAVVDASFLKYKGQWWMFYTLQSDPHRKLYIAYANKLTGPWQKHKKQPVKNDISSSRSAGTLFTYKDKIYRPAQDCSNSYGGAIKINEITKLTPDDFEEKTIKYVRPYMDSKYKQGLHTISQVGNITLLDGKRYLYKLRPIKEIYKIIKEKIITYGRS